MTLRAFLLALFPLSAILAGCAAQQYRWTKPGMTGADLATDRRACLVETEDRFNPYEDYGSPIGRTTITERHLNAQIRYEEIFRDCMQARGYRLVPVPPGP